jgi:hypothetical protein
MPIRGRMSLVASKHPFAGLLALGLALSTASLVSAQDHASVHEADPFDTLLVGHIKYRLKLAGISHTVLQPPGCDKLSFQTKASDASRAKAVLESDASLKLLERPLGREDERPGAGIDWSKIGSPGYAPAIVPDALLLQVAAYSGFRTAAGPRHKVLSFHVREVRYVMSAKTTWSGKKCVVRVAEDSVSGLRDALDLVFDVDRQGLLYSCDPLPTPVRKTRPGRAGPGEGLGTTEGYPALERMYRYERELEHPTQFWAWKLMDGLRAPTHIGTQWGASQDLDGLALILDAADDPIVLRAGLMEPLAESGLTNHQKLALGLAIWARSGDNCHLTPNQELRSQARRLFKSYVRDAPKPTNPQDEKLLSYVELAAAMCQDSPGGGDKVQALRAVAAKYQAKYPDCALAALYGLAGYLRFMQREAEVEAIRDMMLAEFKDNSGHNKFRLAKANKFYW